jgi:hypothetical protein
MSQTSVFRAFYDKESTVGKYDKVMSSIQGKMKEIELIVDEKIGKAEYYEGLDANFGNWLLMMRDACPKESKEYEFWNAIHWIFEATTIYEANPVKDAVKFGIQPPESLQPGEITFDKIIYRLEAEIYENFDEVAEELKAILGEGC